MIVIQQDYSGSRDRWEGAVDSGETPSYLSRTIDSAGVGLGKAVFRSAGSRNLTGMFAAGTFFGITAADLGVASFRPAALDASGKAVNDFYPPYSTINVLRKGTIWVIAGSAVTKDARVYLTSGGAFTAVSSGNEAIPATFVDADSAGELVRVRLNF